MPVTLPALLNRLEGVQPSGTGYLAFCPAHDDRTKRSLSVTEKGGRILLKCFAGCPFEKIVGALNLRPADLRTGANGERSRSSEIVATYNYIDEHGTLLYQVVRYDPKDFRPRRPDGRGGWIWNLQGVRRVVYGLPDLGEHEWAFGCEGEKDADRLKALGLPAFTTQGGAASWRPEYAQQLLEVGLRAAVLLPHQDDAGRQYTVTGAASLTAIGLTARILTLPGLSEHGDVSDWLDAGHTKDELLRLAAEAPIFSSAGSPVAAETPTPADRQEAHLHREGLDLALDWLDGTRLVLAAIRDGREGVRGELTVTRHGQRLSWGSWSLSSTQARETLRKRLSEKAPGVAWDAYLETAAWRLTRAAREGEPLVTLTGRVTSLTRELLPRFLYEGEPTLLYADGDTGKSLVALTLEAAIQSGTALPGGLTPSRAVPCAYLDWETSRDTIEGRLALVAAGLGIEPPGLLYKRMTRPLVDEAAELAAEFARRRIGFVVVDSKMFAVAGGEGAAFHEPVTSFYNALRLFAPAATLVLNHVTNADARSGLPARPFGGAFAWNGPRLIWEAKRDHDVDDATAIVFTCRKANNLPRKPEPFGLRFQAHADRIDVTALDLQEATPQTMAGASLVYRLKVALHREAKTVAALAEALGVTEDSIRRTLNRWRRKDRKGVFVAVADSSPQLWALAVGTSP